MHAALGTRRGRCRERWNACGWVRVEWRTAIGLPVASHLPVVPRRSSTRSRDSATRPGGRPRSDGQSERMSVSKDESRQKVWGSACSR